MKLKKPIARLKRNEQTLVAPQKKTKVKSLTNFNNNLTIEEAKALLAHSGPISYPNTAHNRKVIADLIHKQLKKMQKKQI